MEREKEREREREREGGRERGGVGAGTKIVCVGGRERLLRGEKLYLYF